MKKIALILPYFGRFPQWMNLYLKSCKNNPTIDFLIFTDDDTCWNYPNNVIVYKCNLKQCQKRIEDKLGVTFNFDFTPYKLVDFKVAYGVIFEEYITQGGYDFWGFCDCDIIWGDIRKFIPQKILNNYDKIGIHGHLEIFRNDYTYNRLFLLGTENIPFRKLLVDNSISWYDEYNGIATIYHELGIQQYTLRERIVDIYPDKTEGYFVDVDPQYNYKYQIFKYDNGRLYQLKLNKDGRYISKKELMYIHFQKIKLPVLCADSCDRFYICKNGFTESMDSISDDVLHSGKYTYHLHKRMIKRVRIMRWKLIRAFKVFSKKKIRDIIF